MNLMLNIPETGGGLTGFLAHYLWMVYRYFPSSGHYDWLILLIVMALIVNFLHLPYLWKCVKDDIKKLKEKISELPDQIGLINLWDIICNIFLLIFFNSAGGRTLLADRQFFELTELNQCTRWFYFISLGIIVCAIGINAGMEKWIYRGLNIKMAGKINPPQPFPERDLVSLYLGGGLYEDRKGEIWSWVSLIKPHVWMIFLAHIFYWNWSVASLVLMHCFVLSAVVYEICRMTFVYIHHKRAFG